MTKTLAVLSALVVAGALATAGASNRSASGMTPTEKIAIRHVERGCHVWLNGKVQKSYLRLHLMRGAQLQITNRDIEPHELVQLAGRNLRLQGHMMPGLSQVIRFEKPGLYRFKTRVVSMGPVPDVKTMGPANSLRMKVVVHDGM